MDGETTMNDKTPTIADLEKELHRLQADLDKLRKKPKDMWDRVQVLSALLVPLAIAFAGFVFSQSSKQAEIEVAEKNAKVSQAQLIHTFLDPLTSEDSQKRKIAVEAVLMALPEDGPRLVSLVQSTDPDKSVREFAGGRLAVNAVIRALRRYTDFQSDTATVADARRMLVGAGLRRISVDEERGVVTGQVDDTFSIRIWPGSYNKKNVYGVRYGTDDPQWDWQSTYFEIVIPVSSAAE